MNKLPPIFANTSEAIVPARVIAEFPVNTFLENIAIAPQGDIFVTSYEEGKIYRLTPSGDQSDFAKIDETIAGIAVDRDSNLLVVSSIGSKTLAVFRINQNSTVETLVTLPDAIFLNGMTNLTGDRYLIADSYKGAIWEVDAIAKTACIWLQHEMLTPSDSHNPTPGVNGLKIYRNTLYASNTQRQQLLRIPLSSDYAPDTPEVFLTNVNLDDFAFDSHGNLYGTTHVYNSVVRIAPDGQVTTIAKAEQGMTGSTALAFGRTLSDNTAVYVTTNGGMSLPPETGVAPAKVVRLEVGVAGLTVKPSEN